MYPKILVQAITRFVFHSSLHVVREMGIKIYRDHFHGIYNNPVIMLSMHEVHTNAYRGDRICLYMSVHMFQATLGRTRRILP
jgi:hypothetical protein